MKIDDVLTPAPLVDVDVMENNIRRFQRHCNAVKLRNRPHIKTHKIVELARLQLDEGANGITCQKLSEAEVMSNYGCDDVLITFNLLGAPKLARAVALARKIRLSTVTDNEIVAQGLSDAFSANGMHLPILIECDTGRGRCGVQTPESAVALAKRIVGMKGLEFAGFMTYPAKDQVARTIAFFTELQERCTESGLKANVMSSGGTPNMWESSTAGGITEHRAGTYIYNDRMIVAAGAAKIDDCALTILATVVSHPIRDRVILDAGSKSLAADAIGPGAGYGYIREYPEAKIERLNEEHGIVDVSRCPNRPSIGERVRIIPNHACVVSNLHDVVYGLQRDDVVAEWKVAARGTTV